LYEEVFVKYWNNRAAALAILLTVGLCSALLQAETGQDAWLRYAPLDSHYAQQYSALPAVVTVLDDSAVLKSAQGEIVRGVRGMLGRTLRESNALPAEPAIVLGTFADLSDVTSGAKPLHDLVPGSYVLTSGKIHGVQCIIIEGADANGVLYGAFALLNKIAFHQSLVAPHEVQQPAAPVRWADQWDNLNGTIERGYGGNSIFFAGNTVRPDLSRASEYARILASVGLNGCNVNNVNASPHMLDDGMIRQLARIADVFRPWGVKMAISVDFDSPKTVGDLNTFDPLDPKVIAWWQHKVDEIYQQIPDFGGFTVKADSEGQSGPSSYGRSPADAANMLASALKPHGGVLLYRAFVYNHHLDWNNPKNDRARAAYDIFHPLDGKFGDNVIIQIKYGPIDFQVREPVSPLFSGLEKTNEAIELQVTQEYTGQQRHLCYLAPLWKEVFDFDLHANGGSTPVKDLITGKIFHRPTGGFVGVVNVGMDDKWMGNPMALANVYSFGRLAWNPNQSVKDITEDWTRLTFGDDPLVVETVVNMQLASWPAYEDYTGPLGLQTLTNIVGPHYGPGVESSENNGWGMWHRADHEGVGMDRSVATGTGFAGQYFPAVAKMYESVQTTPDNLLLFFHHVPYTYKLHSGKTVIQELYDLHYQGAERAYEFIAQWESLRGRVDDERYDFILNKFKYQAGHAIVWRDAVCNWFFRESGIADAKGRVGRHPDRVEAEDMKLDGYAPIDISPRENASGGKGVQCAESAKTCTASYHFTKPAGWYEIDVQYFDQMNGQSKFQVMIGDQIIDEWIADDHLPAMKPNGDSSTRRWITGIALRPGDEIRIVGTPDNGERAPVDYVRIVPRNKTEKASAANARTRKTGAISPNLN
jgi:alpha-glucuronidase